MGMTPNWESVGCESNTIIFLFLERKDQEKPNCQGWESFTEAVKISGTVWLNPSICLTSLVLWDLFYYYLFKKNPHSCWSAFSHTTVFFDTQELFQLSHLHIDLAKLYYCLSPVDFCGNLCLLQSDKNCVWLKLRSVWKDKRYTLQ